MTNRKLELIKAAALDKKALDLEVIELAASFADYFLICSGDSPLHRKAIVQAIYLSLKKDGDPIHHQEGDNTSDWILLDCYDVIVHVFAPESRDQYDLASIWTNSKKIS